MLGYQPHIVTTGRSFLAIVLVQLLASFPPAFAVLFPWSGEQAAIAPAAASRAAAVIRLFLFIDMISLGGSQRTKAVRYR
ncbi:hypothetical protein GCM10023193_44410 [Planotetraspora kaengkrachanensis]|uniref:Uncharacterized protein n=1 Tax=Planotetraspora kaengkrachanensis TaxID=575193 RepID=A0A8J3PYD6_9ACTN|nr:hypothetical protein Pka01_65160 [Planotetraspora kaengkrachanensis]